MTEEQRQRKNEWTRKYRAENRERINANRRSTRDYSKDKEWRVKNRARHNECKARSARECRKKNPARIREYERIAAARRDPLKKKLYFQEYAKKNRERRRTYLLNQRRTNPNHKLSVYLRTRIRMQLRRNSTSCSIKHLLGTTIAELKNYLESNFKENMSWKNWGIHGWHIDHIIPISSFDLTDPEQQRRCFHYTNLQPLWSWENLTKHAKII